MIFRCPFCYLKGEEKRYNRAGNLIRHIFFSHNKGIKIAIIIEIVGFVLTISGIYIGFYNEDIRYRMDKLWGKEPNINLVVSIYYPIKIKGSEINEIYHSYLINKQKQLGIIPEWADKEPIRFRIYDEEEIIGCDYFAYHNAKEKIIINGKEYTQISFKFPEQEDFFSIISNCSNCFAYVFYILNDGKRKIENLNLKICSEEDSKILFSSKEIISESNNCFRLFSENIDIGKSTLGYVVIKKNHSSEYNDYWGENIFSLYEGDITILSKKIEINRKPTLTINAFIPNVTC